MNRNRPRDHSSNGDDVRSRKPLTQEPYRFPNKVRLAVDMIVGVGREFTIVVELVKSVPRLFREKTQKAQSEVSASRMENTREYHGLQEL